MRQHRNVIQGLPCGQAGIRLRSRIVRRKPGGVNHAGLHGRNDELTMGDLSFQAEAIPSEQVRQSRKTEVSRGRSTGEVIER